MAVKFAKKVKKVRGKIHQKNLGAKIWQKNKKSCGVKSAIMLGVKWQRVKFTSFLKVGGKTCN